MDNEFTGFFVNSKTSFDYVDVLLRMSINGYPWMSSGARLATKSPKTGTPENRRASTD